MKERLYVPVDCPCCHKRGVLALGVMEVEAALEEDAPIMLQCAFDDSRWIATSSERRRIARLSVEQALMANSSWLKLDPSHSQGSHRSW